MKEIVSATWLYKKRNDPKLIILDASIDTSASGKAFEKFACTIPKARQFDLKHVFVDKTSPFPNTIPSPKAFELACKKLGINQDSEIVVFDTSGIYASPRAWWLFKVMGHEKVAVLNGGLPDWVECGFHTDTKHLETFEMGDFKANFDETSVIHFEEVVKNTTDKKFTIVDARSESRFKGTGKEPRKQLQSGHIQNSVNIPYQDVLQDGKYKSKDELKQLFKEKCGNEKELVFSCGSGMTACIVLLANRIADSDSLKLYDGSWTEWAERNDLKTIVP